MSTFSIHTLGCKLNYSESSHISRELQERGFSLSNTPDYILVNTCAVTATAEKKCRNAISKWHRENPSAKIIVMGCYSALKADTIAQWDGVCKVFGNADKINVIEYLTQNKVAETPHFFATFSSHDRTRSFLKIQDGCDYHCAYCTVARARGESRSDSIANVLDNMLKIEKLGLQEVNLTGVNVGDFGRKEGENFTQLVLALEQQSAVPRIRISSIEPNLLTREIIDVVAQSSVFLPHFHIPLQSGCNRILTLMQRRYKRELFAEKVRYIKEKMPHACIAIDVIAGFPSESDHDFTETYHFLESLPLSYLHVFTYSRRPNTPATAMKEQVPEPTKRERTHALLELSKAKKETFYHQNIGQTRLVLWEEEQHNNTMFGFTDNYIKIKAPYQLNSVNKIEPTLITKDNIVLSDI